MGRKGNEGRGRPGEGREATLKERGSKGREKEDEEDEARINKAGKGGKWKAEGKGRRGEAGEEAHYLFLLELV